MRSFLLGFLFTISKIFLHPSYAQDKIATLEKNSNVLAKELYHGLNEKGDTLVLKSAEKMDYIYSINRNNKREIDCSINKTDFKIPINQLSQGKHLFAVSYRQRKILFVVRVYDPKTSYVAIKRAKDVATRNN